MTEKRNKIKKQRTLLQKSVNIFLYSGIGLLFILLVAFGFSQTSTFRELLREKVIELAGSELNGKLYIEKIDGTIFTSLTLRGVTITMEQDTLLNAGVIGLKTSPLQLLLKKIFVRSLEIKDAKISLVKDSAGVLNIVRLIPPAPVDTTTSKFAFKIIAHNIQLSNVDFSLQNYDKKNSTSVYNHLNTNDIQLKNLNLHLSAAADINGEKYILELKSLSFLSNLKVFSLKDFSGNFEVNTSGLYADNVKIQTETSDVKFSARLEDYNIFDTSSLIGSAKANLELNTDSFNFDDLSSFLPATDILKGTLSADIKATGRLNKLNINRLDIKYLDTHLNAVGSITDLIDPLKMYIKVKFSETRIKQSDVKKLLPTLSIPDYKRYGILNVDTLLYEGSPLKFNSTVYVKTLLGDVSAKLALNLTNADMEYNLSFNTKNLNLSPIISLTTNVNSKGTIKGKGIKLERLNAVVNFNGDASSIEGVKIDTLRFGADAQNKNIKFNTKLISNALFAVLGGAVQFSNEKDPAYSLKGTVENLNLAKVFKDSTIKSNLNFALDANGENFNPDSMNLFLSLDISKSEVRGVNIDSTRLIADVRRNDGGKKIINIISDLADITVTGNFSTIQVANLFKGETKLLSDAVNAKMNDIVSAAPNTKNIPLLDKTAINPAYFDVMENPSQLKYNIEFKDFTLLSIFLGNNTLELNGEVDGELINTTDSLYATLNTNLDYLKYWGESDVFFISKLNFGLKLSNSLSSRSLDNINADIFLKTNRLFTGSDFHDLFLDFNLKNNVAAINFSGMLEDYFSTHLKGNVDLNGTTLKLGVDSLMLAYNQYIVNNKVPFHIVYSSNIINVDNLVLIHNNKGEIRIDGLLRRTGNQNLSVNAKNINLNDISQTILQLLPENSLNANLNFNSQITGNFSSPQMKINLIVNDVAFKNKKFGSLITNLYYQNKNVDVDVKFIDTLTNRNKPVLSLKGNIPVDLSFKNVQERFNKSKGINLNVFAADFNLATLGNLLPGVDQLKGILAANIKISGTPKDLKPYGVVTVSNGSFIAEVNNLEYYTGFKMTLNGSEISLDSMVVENSKNTKDGGRMTGSGKALLSSLEIKSSEFSLNGQLKVLSSASKSVSPSLYGDLVLATNNALQIRTDKNGVYLNASILAKKASLMFLSTQETYKNTADNFIYRYVEDTAATGKTNMSFENLVRISQERSARRSIRPAKKSRFDYNINVKVENEATIVFVLAREINQNLTAVLKGNFEYVSIDGKPIARGELTLVQGSTLEYIKTFQAEGSIKFENDLTNPYLDITGIYKNFYTPSDSAQQSTEQEVAVKIRIKGPLDELGSNFVKDKNSIAVYVGANNIDNNIADPTKDISDAVMFIIYGKFLADVSQGQQIDAFKATATSLAGSILGGILNRSLGDYVRSIQFSQIGSIYRFNLIGKVNNFRYEIGGSSDIFQDLSRANIKIEYPLFKKLLLRLERKEDVTNNSINTEMINELGLKYKFEF